uniref:Anoctamin n=1 Tax=Hucho hucho TaxID=62062 RepID=A0A4W5L238_9TELE
MFLSLLVAWVIPDVPKNISEQLKREKTLLVDVFLREEKEKFHLLQSQPPGGEVGESRARCRAASFSQFTRPMSTSPSNNVGRQMSMSPRNDAARHTAV